MPQRTRATARRKTGTTSGTTYAAIEKMLLGWPGVALSTSYGRPSLKIAGKFFTWVKEDGDSIVIGGIGFDERDVLMQTQGDVFYVTDHYRNSRDVLMRLSKADPAVAAAYLRRRWFEIAPKKLHAAFGEARPLAKPAAKSSRGKASAARPSGKRRTRAT